MQQPQKTLTLQLTGQTSKLILTERFVIDVTSALHWFLLSHRISVVRVPIDLPSERVEFGAINATDLVTLPPVDDETERMVRELVRFASLDGNIARLLKILSLKQIASWLKEPLTYQRLVTESPETVIVPRWYDPGRPDLKTKGLVPNGF